MVRGRQKLLPILIVACQEVKDFVFSESIPATAEIADDAFDEQRVVVQLVAQVVEQPLNQSIHIWTRRRLLRVVRMPAPRFLKRQTEIQWQRTLRVASLDGL